MPKISIIIVNYNTRDVLRDCLNNLMAIPKPEKEVIVVDNGSTDGSAQMVKEDFPTAILVETENGGLAAGQNRGLEEATGEYILYLGTDAFPEKGTIAGTVDYLEKAPSEVGIVTPKLVLRNGKPDMDAHRGFPTPWASFTHFTKLNKLFPGSRLFNRYFLGYENLKKPHEIDLCISHFMLVKREVHEKIGTWDTNFYVYGEDVDFCYRAKQAGFKIMYLPQFKAIHYKGAGVGIRKETSDIKTASSTDPQVRRRMREETTKAMKLFYQKHYQNKYPKLVTNLILLGIAFMAKLRAR